MNKITFFVMTILFTGRSFAQAEPPKYAQATAIFTKFYNENLPDSIFTQFSPELKKALPEEKFVSSTTQLKDELGKLLKIEFYKYEAPVAVYKVTFQSTVFLLNIALNSNNKFTGLQLSPYKQEDPNITESPITVKTLSSTISGTIAMPKNVTGKVPVVLIIPTMGNIDRNGNGDNIAANEYKLLASALGKNGIASLRYDKRRVGESKMSAKESELRFDDYFDDANGLIGTLSEDKRFSKIIVLGHGQGSLIGMIAAQNDAVNAFISLEGTALQGDKYMIDLINRTYPKYIADGFKNVLDTMRRGRVNNKVDAALYPVARPGIQMYLMTWFRFPPQEEIKQLKKPVLIIQGSTDLDIAPNSGELLKKSKAMTLTIINGMNYVLKEAPADKDQNLATYSKPDLPLKPELVTAIVDFIKKP